jgi:hypothetical protein
MLSEDCEINPYARRNEGEIRATALNLEAMQKSGILISDCQPCRGKTGGCPNGMKCRNKFAGLADVIMAFRRLVFDGVNEAEDRNKGKDEGRRKNLETLLLLGRQFTLEGPVINFTIQGVPVCKSFYRECTGLVRQFFESTLSTVLYGGGRSRQKKEGKPPKAKIPEELKIKVVAILDRMFKSKRSKGDPTGKCEAMSIRSSWQDIFDTDFMKFTGGIEIVTYRQFCHIRFSERPYYHKSPRLKKSKW